MVDIDGQFGWMKKHLGICEALGVCVPETDQEGSVWPLNSSLDALINDGIGWRYWELQTGRAWMEEVHGHGYVLGAISCPGPYPCSPSVFCFLDMKSNLCHISCHHGFLTTRGQVIMDWNLEPKEILLLELFLLGIWSQQREKGPTGDPPQIYVLFIQQLELICFCVTV